MACPLTSDVGCAGEDSDMDNQVLIISFTTNNGAVVSIDPVHWMIRVRWPDGADEEAFGDGWCEALELGHVRPGERFTAMLINPFTASSFGFISTSVVDIGSAKIDVDDPDAPPAPRPRWCSPRGPRME